MKRLLLVGGDKRAVYLADLLRREGYSVQTLGLSDDETVTWEAMDCVLFPYPFSVKNGRIPMLEEFKIAPEEVLAKIPQTASVIAGRGLEGYIAQESGRMKRYTDAEGFEKRNAELSAEAAVFEAMMHCRVALMDSRVLVTGYGLFGKAIAARLKTLGAEVWIAARREAQRLQAIEEGMKTVSILDMADVLPRMDLIMNTIPARVFCEYHLKRLRKECWLMELASAPYGFDLDMAKALGVQCVLLPGLPAKYSPRSAAMALRDAVVQLLEEDRA